jgi:hypothetical protein
MIYRKATFEGNQSEVRLLSFKIHHNDLPRKSYSENYPLALRGEDGKIMKMGKLEL